jgi:hypothetical protein
VGKRHSLPIVEVSRSPTVDAARKRLGGRGESDAGAGDLVAFGSDQLGVVLFVKGDDLEVWIDDGLVRRLGRGATRAADAVVSKQLADIADAARAFAQLAEGARVRYRDDVRIAEGTLVEKCRFGALVERADGSIVAVGFRRLLAGPVN